MHKIVSIVLGKPQHGWLPVNFHYDDFHLDFTASDVFNDPAKELCNAISKLQENEVKRTTFWLEPGAYFFDFERKGQVIVLTIIETCDFHNEALENRQLIRIIGNEEEIIEPFRCALRQFAPKSGWT